MDSYCVLKICMGGVDTKGSHLGPTVTESLYATVFLLNDLLILIVIHCSFKIRLGFITLSELLHQMCKSFSDLDFFWYHSYHSELL